MSFAEPSCSGAGPTVFNTSFSGTKSKQGSRCKQPSQWRRKSGPKNVEAMKVGSEEGLMSKRKGTDEDKISSKITKCVEKEVVLHEEPPKQV